MSENYKIFTYLDDIQDTFNTSTERVSGLHRNPKQVIRTIEFYTSNQYLSGNLDALGREKPFYNVCNYRVTVAKTATDLDVKDIRFEPDLLKYSIQSMLINHELYKYLKEAKFSKLLNDAGNARPKYGGLLLKKSKVNGKLTIEVMDVVNVDFDPSDVLGGPMVETRWMQPSELARMDYWENVDEVLKAHNKLNKNKPAKIEVKEVLGDFPDSFYPPNDNNAAYAESSSYQRMCFYIAVVGKKKYMLYYEYEKDNRIKYLPWEEMGNGWGRGVVEDGFEAQTWENDAMISYKNIMDLASKIVITTDSQKVSGNAITGVDNGHIFQLEQGRTMNLLSLMPNAIPQIEKLIGLWDDQYNKIASTFDANTGEAPTANTPYSQTALLNQVANSPFEFRREEWGIFLNGVLNDWIMPELKKRIKKKHYLVSEFSNEELDLIDESIANFEGNNIVFEKMMNEGITSTEQDGMLSGIKEELKKKGPKREIDIPEGYLDVEGNLTANITGELKNKAALLQSLDNVFKSIISTMNPQTGEFAALQNPVLANIFGQIVELSGIPITSGQLRPSQTPVSQPDMSAVAQPAPALTK